MTHDIIALIWSYLYVGTIVVVGEGAKRLGLATEFARKIIHVGVGLWIFGTLALFHSPYMAVIPPLTAAAGNYVIHRKRLLKAVEAEPENLGTVWFPIAFSALILLFWDYPLAVTGGVMAMTIGDALASTVGLRVGRHPYQTLRGKRKSLEGSLAMLLGTWAALWATMAIVTPAILRWKLGAAAGSAEAGGFTLILTPLAASLYLWPSALAAVVGMCTEALGINGLDNLWVPLSAGITVFVALYLPQPAVTSLAVGALLAVAIGVLAWLKGSLTPSGVLGAILTGALLFGVGGWPGGLALVGFFVSSSVLSKLFRRQKRTVEEEYAKTGTRDFGQAMANGGVAALAALLLGITGDPRFMGALVGALAAANADTWATELGVLSRTAPRLITTFRKAQPGTSGAISLAGTGAAAAGAAFVGAVAALGDRGLWRFVPWALLAGLAGALLDSLLGATAQGVYWCPRCSKETERTVHRCGERTVLRRGLAWLGNDTVNLLATLAGAVIGYLAA
jgi:uncharacterized protein (TIGR00297 family)